MLVALIYSTIEIEGDNRRWYESDEGKDEISDFSDGGCMIDVWKEEVDVAFQDKKI